MIPTFIYPIGYTLIDTFLVVFIKATSVHGKTSYNSITVNAITEFIKLCIAIYVAHGEGSLYTLRSIVTDPGLMIRFAIPNLMYAVNNNLFHYSVGALPPAVFVVAINAFRTMITAILQPCVSNKALTSRQILACALLMLSFVFASLPEVIKVAFSGAMKGSTLESLLYLSAIYSVISVIASLSQEKLLKDSKSLMVANIINYSIGISFQLGGMAYEKITVPETDLFRGLDVFWVRAIPCMMALVGLSISFVLKYYDNIVKLLCSSVSVLLVNTITAMMSGDSMFNVYFLAGWLLTFPATYLYYIAPEVASSANTEQQILKSTDRRDSAKSELDIGDEEESQSLLEPKNDGDKLPLEKEFSEQKDKGKVAQSWFQKISKERLILGGIVSGLVIFSTLTSTFEIEAVEEKLPSSGPSAHLFPQYLGIEDVEQTCSLYEVPYSDPRSNLRVVDTYRAKYGEQYVTSDYRNGDIFVSCMKDLYISGPDSAEYRSLRQSRRKTQTTEIDHQHKDKDIWEAVPKSALEQINDWKNVLSLLSLQRQSDEEAKADSTIKGEDSSTVEAESRHMLQTGRYQRLPWSFIDDKVGQHAQYFWIWCSDFTDANLVPRPPVLAMAPEPARGPLPANFVHDVKNYVNELSLPNDDTSSKKQGIRADAPKYDTVLVLYLDAISRIKFEKFYRRSKKILDTMATASHHLSNEASGYIHSAVELKRLHAVGINSEKNYPQFLAGVRTDDTKRFYLKQYDELLALKNKTSNITPTESMLQSLLKTTDLQDIVRREPWIFDIAEQAGFITSAGVTSCPGRCHSDCYNRSQLHGFYEQGGFHSQYMAETNERMPGQYNYPITSYCESSYRSVLRNHACSTCDSPHLHSKLPDTGRSTWIANKLGMSYVLDWWRTWLASTAMESKDGKKSRFGVIVLEETHQQDFLEQFDIELANFLHDLTYSGSRRRLFGTERLAMVVMADHGLHFMSEFKVPTGKIANKQPFGYVIIPRVSAVGSSTEKIEKEATQYQTLLRNSHALTTSYDIRATILSWLTGREWSSDAISHADRNHRRLPVQSFMDRLHNQPRLQSTTPRIRQQIFASQHGLNLMTSSVPFNRTCADAGIPADFCGCNLQPCTGEIKHLVRDSAKAVVTYINKHISDVAPQTLSVCKPLHESELIFVPGMDDCLSSSKSIVVNAYIQPSMKLISITYVYENEYSSAKYSSLQKWQHPRSRPKLRVANVNTISNYGKIWNQCKLQFAAKNISQSIPDDSFQFCYCVNDRSWLSTAAGIIKALDF